MVNEKARRWEWWATAALITVAIFFSAIVEMRSAFLSRRMGDLGVFLRAGWAVRTGHSIYDVTCDNDYHYHYPPLFAILMAPLADPPHGENDAGMVPYSISVALFYGLSLFWLGLAVHWMAGALEEAFPALRSVPANRRWLYLRVFPLWVCLLPIGHSVSRGQVTTLWMVIVAGMIGSVLRGRRLTAGLYLAGAICLKIIPLYLLIYPLWRRDGRLLVGCALGLVFGLGVVPVVAMGPAAAGDAYRQLGQALLAPGLGVGSDQSRTAELIGMGATSNVSFQAVIYHLTYGSPTDPAAPAPPWVRRAHWLLGGVLTLVTLAAAGWRDPKDRITEALLLGALTLLNLLVSPVCHTLYFALLAAPLATLMALEWRQADLAGQREEFCGLGVSGRTAALAFMVFVCNVFPLLPALEAYRNLGVATCGALLVWASCCMAMRRLRQFPGRPATAAASTPEAA